ncbi:hypothetical protein WG66_008984 [Moniliophthora roreri]|nr:hypothetical protein WG66_008984 [Moniliophthora roreri]
MDGGLLGSRMRYTQTIITITESAHSLPLRAKMTSRTGRCIVPPKNRSSLLRAMIQSWSRRNTCDPDQGPATCQIQTSMPQLPSAVVEDQAPIVVKSPSFPQAYRWDLARA